MSRTPKLICICPRTPTWYFSFLQSTAMCVLVSCSCPGRFSWACFCTPDRLFLLQNLATLWPFIWRDGLPARPCATGEHSPTKGGRGGKMEGEKGEGEKKRRKRERKRKQTWKRWKMQQACLSHRVAPLWFILILFSCLLSESTQKSHGVVI